MTRFLLAVLLLGIALGQSIAQDAQDGQGAEIVANISATEFHAGNMTFPEKHIEAILNKGFEFGVFLVKQILDFGIELGFKHPTYGTQSILVWIAFLLFVSPFLPIIFFAAAATIYLAYKAAEWLWKNWRRIW